MYCSRIKLLILTGVVSLTNAFCGNVHTFRGKISDPKGNPIGYANVELLSPKDSSFLSGTGSEINGTFRLSYKEMPSYLLRISSVGYQTVYRLESGKEEGPVNVVLPYGEVVLKGVEIRGNRPLFLKKEDHLIFNVRNMAHKEGMKASDVLKFAPEVNYGSDGSLLVGGKPATVFVNGRRLSEEETASYLSAMRAEEIDKIEIEKNNNGSKEADIKGGIVYIETISSERGLKLNAGWDGSLYRSGYYGLNPNFNLFYGTKKWNVYGFYNYDRSRNLQHSVTKNRYMDVGDIHESTEDYFSKPEEHVYKIGSVFYAGKRQSFGLEFNGIADPTQTNQGLGNVNYYEASNGINDRAASFTNYTKSSDFYNGVLYYNWEIDSLKSNLKVLLNYNNKKNRSENYLQTKYEKLTDKDVDEKDLSNMYANNITEQADYRKFWKSGWSILSGEKYLLTDRRSNLTTLNNKGDSVSGTGWKYTEKISSLYLGLTGRLNKKISLSATCRMEHTSIDGSSTGGTKGNLRKSYTDWFPYFRFSQDLTDKANYSITYTKTIYRPPFELMNNYKNRISDVLYDIGNPNLRPEKENDIELDFNYGNHYTSFSYAYKPNLITEYFYAEKGITYHTNLNFGSMKTLEWDYDYAGKILKWWQTNFYVAGIYREIPKSYNKTHILYGMIYFNNSFTIGKAGVLYLEYDGNTNNISANTYMKGNSWLNASYSYSMFKKTLNVRFGVNDLFNSKKMRMHTIVPTLDYSFYAKNLSRQFWVSLTYNFSTGGKLNTEVIKNTNAIKARL